jgi:hypothetical protein
MYKLLEFLIVVGVIATLYFLVSGPSGKNWRWYAIRALFTPLIWPVFILDMFREYIKVGLFSAAIWLAFLYRVAAFWADSPNWKVGALHFAFGIGATVLWMILALGVMSRQYHSSINLKRA